MPPSSLRRFWPQKMAPPSVLANDAGAPRSLRLPRCGDSAASAMATARCFSEDSSRLHSTDIAFKPAESGWGGGGKYGKNFDAIFGNATSPPQNGEKKVPNEAKDETKKGS